MHPTPLVKQPTMNLLHSSLVIAMTLSSHVLFRHADISVALRSFQQGILFPINLLH